MLSQNIFTEKLQYENRLTIFVSSFFIIMIINKDSIFVFLYLREKSKSFFISKFYKNRVRKNFVRSIILFIDNFNNNYNIII